MLRVGTDAPDFKLRLESGELFHLRALEGKQPAVVLFLPNISTLDLSSEGYTLIQHVREAATLHAVVLAVSPWPLQPLREFAARYDVPLFTAQDPTLEVCRNYRVLWLRGSAVRRTTYVLDPSRVIRACLHHDLFPDKHWSSVLRTLRSFDASPDATRKESP
jgi:peroxiredoxin